MFAAPAAAKSAGPRGPAATTKAPAGAGADAGAGTGAGAGAGAGAAGGALVSDWDDADGYLKVRPGDVLGDRYRVESVAGGGMFAQVYLCRDTREAERVVAIKVIRNHELTRRQGMRELEFLTAVHSFARKLRRQQQHLQQQQQQQQQQLAHGVQHEGGGASVVRLLGHFADRLHLCLVLEPMECSLRELLHRFGRGVGVSLDAVRVYGRALLHALALLRAQSMVHADIKPDNMLVDSSLSRCVLSDLGSMFREDDPDNTPTQELVSRFYRAPEIVLGLRPDPALDVWSAGCVLFELFTGEVLFRGETNNDLMWHMQLVCGPLPLRLVRRHLHACDANPQFIRHFTPDGAFIRYPLAPPSTSAPAAAPSPPSPSHPPSSPPPPAAAAAAAAGGGGVLREIRVSRSDPRREVAPRLEAKRGPTEAAAHVKLLADLITHMLTLDRARRILPDKALEHPFFTTAPDS
jgi:serine/threonine-protein kinase PRP4